MKIALCLHGLVGTDDKYGAGEKIINYKIGLDHFKRHVFDVNDEVDVFFHTWSEDYEQKLIDAYSPIAHIAEKQPFYDDNLRKQAIYCRWNSANQVLNLVEESGNEYDFILLTRFDIAFLVDFDFSKYDKSKFYAQGPAGPKTNGVNLINDLWFFSNQDNMLKFCDIYNVLNDKDYQVHIDSNHELARKHLDLIGLNDKLEYVFKREWTGAAGKLNSDTPLVRWHYKKKV